MISVRVSGVETAIAGLKEFGSVKSRLTQAVRATIRETKQAGVAKMRSRYTAKKVLGKQSVRASGLTGVWKLSGKRNELKRFLIKPRSRPKKMPPGGVYAQVVRGQGGQISRAFIWRGHVFERVGRPRLPIRELKTVSLPGMAGNPHVAPYIEAKMEERLGINLENLL